MTGAASTVAAAPALAAGLSRRDQAADRFAGSTAQTVSADVLRTNTPRRGQRRDDGEAATAERASRRGLSAGTVRGSAVGHLDVDQAVPGAPAEVEAVVVERLTVLDGVRHELGEHQRGVVCDVAGEGVLHRDLGSAGRVEPGGPRPGTPSGSTTATGRAGRRAGSAPSIVTYPMSTTGQTPVPPTGRVAAGLGWPRPVSDDHVDPGIDAAVDVAWRR